MISISPQLLRDISISRVRSEIVIMFSSENNAEQAFQQLKNIALGTEWDIERDAEQAALEWGFEPATSSFQTEQLFQAIKHGSPEHQAWLKEAIECHFAGKPIPEPTP